MTSNNLEILLSKFISLREDISLLAIQLSHGNIIAFDKVTVLCPDLKIPIHGFYTCVSWLYIHYFETGRITIDFLAERANALGLDKNGHLKKHKILVHAFRSYLQHNMDLSNREDLAKLQCCKNWIEAHLQESWPNHDNQWTVLLNSLLKECNEFIEKIFRAIEIISKDESSFEIIKILIERIKRQLPPHQYDKIILEVASDMGLQFLDATALRKRFLDKWNKQLILMKDNSDFPLEARRLIEQTLLNEEKLPIPITGRDIINELGVSPGPAIKEMLEYCQRLFREMPRPKEDLLSALKARYFS